MKSHVRQSGLRPSLKTRSTVTSAFQQSATYMGHSKLRFHRR